MKAILMLLSINILLDASYIQMQKYSEASQYSKVLQEAKYSLKDYQNPKLHLLWADAAEKLGKNDEAMSAYERVLILDETNKIALEALEKIYTDTKRVGLSADTKEKTKQNRLRAKVNIALGHDNNVNVNASGDALDGYYGIELGLKKISSNFARVQANASYLYNFENYQNWFIQSTLELYHQNNFSAHRFDLTIPTFEVALGYVKDEYLFYLPVSYNTINYLDRDLLNVFSVTPRVRILFLNNALWDSALIYEKRNYIEAEDTLKDATTLGFETGLYYTADITQIHLNINYESRTSDYSLNERYVDADFFTFDSTLKYYFNTSTIAEAQYLFRYSNYKDNIGTAATPSDISRDDYINEIDIKFSYLLNKNMEVYLQDTYTQSLSTYIPSEYTKNVFLLGFQLRY